MKALVVCYESPDELGTLLPVLDERGFDIDFVIRSEDALPAIDPTHHDLMISLGDPTGVYESDKYPYLLNEISYLTKRLESDLPTFGICFGSQLMAKSLGGNVYKGTNGRETGWREINVTPDGQKSVIRHFDASQTKMTQGHQDTFDLPESCTLLATSNQYKNQAFSYGQNALGFQFHPELNEKILFEVWLKDKDNFLVTDTMSKEQVIADTKIYMDTLQKQTVLFFNEWLDEVELKNA